MVSSGIASQRYVADQKSYAFKYHAEDQPYCRGAYDVEQHGERHIETVAVKRRLALGYHSPAAKPAGKLICGFLKHQNLRSFLLSAGISGWCEINTQVEFTLEMVTAIASAAKTLPKRVLILKSLLFNFFTSQVFKLYVHYTLFFKTCLLKCSELPGKCQK